MAASIDAPMSSVWMWQFQMPSPPTTTIESPMPAQTSLKAGIASSAASRKYMTSYRRSEMSPCSPPVAWPGSGSVNTGPSTSVGTGTGRPSVTWSSTSRNSRNPAPPASTTPASLSTGSISGVRASASAPCARAASSTVTRSPPSFDATTAASEASRTTVRMVPSTGRITAS